MNIGSLNERISIHGLILIDNGLQEVETYSEIKTVWANVSYLNDTQRWAGGAANRNVTIRFIIRVIPSVSLSIKNRIVFNGQTYFVDGVKPYRDGKEFLEITAGLIL